jgi:hypothetical protein
MYVMFLAYDSNVRDFTLKEFEVAVGYEHDIIYYFNKCATAYQ